MCKNRFEKFARIFSRRHEQTTFSDAGFLGSLRVKPVGLVASNVDPDQMLDYAASELCLQCLHRPVCPNTRGVQI